MGDQEPLGREIEGCGLLPRVRARQGRHALPVGRWKGIPPEGGTTNPWWRECKGAACCRESPRVADRRYIDEGGDRNCPLSLWLARETGSGGCGWWPLVTARQGRRALPTLWKAGNLLEEIDEGFEIVVEGFDLRSVTDPG